LEMTTGDARDITSKRIAEKGVRDNRKGQSPNISGAGDGSLAVDEEEEELYSNCLAREEGPINAKKVRTCDEAHHVPAQKKFEVKKREGSVEKRV